jgi:voltage-gated potassium channel
LLSGRTEGAFYFSTSSCATVGYGDVVLPQTWRTLGPVESLIGVLIRGLSATFRFAIVTRLVERETRLSGELAEPLAELISTPKDSNPSGRSRGEKQK